MKAYAIGFFGAVVAILVVAGIWVALQPKPEAGLLWGGTVYSSKQEFNGYLKSKGLSYKAWVARNPGAAPWEPRRAAGVAKSRPAATAKPEKQASEDQAEGLPLTTIGLMLATGCALLLLLRAGPATAAAVAGLSYRRHRTSRPPPRDQDRAEPRDAPELAEPLERAIRSAAALDGLSTAVAEPPVRATARADSSPIQTLSPQVAVDEQVEQVCEILWWRGYIKSQFYVEADPPLSREITSRAFRARGSDAPEQDTAAVAAYEALVEALASAGWAREGRGAHWFSDRFRRC